MRQLVCRHCAKDYNHQQVCKAQFSGACESTVIFVPDELGQLRKEKEELKRRLHQTTTELVMIKHENTLKKLGDGKLSYEELEAENIKLKIRLGSIEFEKIKEKKI